MNLYDESVVLSISCLDNNIENMFNCLTEIFTSNNNLNKPQNSIQLGPQMNDLTHISQLLKIFSSEAANSLVEDSLSYGLSYAASGLRYANSKNEKLQNVFFSFDM